MKKTLFLLCCILALMLSRLTAQPRQVISKSGFQGQSLQIESDFSNAGSSGTPARGIYLLNHLLDTMRIQTGYTASYVATLNAKYLTDSARAVADLGAANQEKSKALANGQSTNPSSGQSAVNKVSRNTQTAGPSLNQANADLSKAAAEWQVVLKERASYQYYNGFLNTERLASQYIINLSGHMASTGAINTLTDQLRKFESTLQ